MSQAAWQDTLASLRDVHVPLEPSWWPLAVGWYLLLMCVALAAFCVIYWFKHRARYWRCKRAAHRHLRDIERAFAQHQDGRQAFEAMSVLLRRVALMFHGPQVAGLTGQAWLEFLDRTSQTQAFSQGVGHHLIKAPYQGQQAISEQQVHDVMALLQQWIKGCRPC